MATSKRTSGPADESNVERFDDADPRGEALASSHLADGQPYEVAPGEDEAEELLDEGGDGFDVEQLSDAEKAAAAAGSSRPVRRSAKSEVSPSKKGRPTAKRDNVAPAEQAKRTGPVQFIQEAIGELRKVVWPTSGQLRQYFTVVLVFVLFIIAFVSLLDLGFGWLLLKLLG